MTAKSIGRICGAAAICLSLLSLPAWAQDANYPTHPVRLIAASAPGGNPDVLARLLSARLS
jgi:tripartite-type tricarboxylate transporter receptor subunit TctC